jgi:anti-anti-sigma regulatory factor
MLKIQRSSNGGVIFTLSGQIETEHVVELQRLLGLEEAGRGIVFNLKDVTLVNRDAVRFLSQCEAACIALGNCPPYIREWIDREKKQT